MFLNNRYHDPTLGTFISVDPLVRMTGEPYIYASGNPTTLSDPTGLCPDAGCWEMLGVVMRELAGLEKPGTTRQRQLELNEAISESIFENYGNYYENGDAMYTPADLEYAQDLKCDVRELCEGEQRDVILEFFEACPDLCLLATGVTAGTFAALTAVACPAGTIASAGFGAAVACGGLAALGAGATNSIYQKTRTDVDQVDGNEVLCSMGAGAVVPPGTDLNVMVRPIATKVAGAAC